MSILTTTRIRALCSDWSNRIKTRLTRTTVTETVNADEAQIPVKEMSTRTLRRKYTAMKKMTLAVTRSRNNYRAAFITTFSFLLMLAAYTVNLSTQTSTTIGSLTANNAEQAEIITQKDTALSALLQERNLLAAQHTSLANDMVTLRQQVSSLTNEITSTKSAIAEREKQLVERDKQLAELSAQRTNSVPTQTIEIRNGQPVAVASKDTMEWWNRPITNTLKGWWDDVTK